MIDPELIARAAELCGLPLPAQERDALAANLAELLARFQGLQEVDTSAVTQLDEPWAVTAPGQDDEVQAFSDPQRLLDAMADHPRGGFFVVPRPSLGPGPAEPSNRGAAAHDPGTEDAPSSPGHGP